MCAFPCFDRFPALFSLSRNDDPSHPAKKFSSNNFFFLCIFLHSTEDFFIYLVCLVVGVFVSIKKTSKGYNNFFRLCSHTHKLLSYFSCLIHVVFRYTLKKASFSFFFFGLFTITTSFFFSTSSIIAAAVGASAFSCPIFVGEEKKNSILLYFSLFFLWFVQIL